MFLPPEPVCSFASLPESSREQCSGLCYDKEGQGKDTGHFVLQLLPHKLLTWLPRIAMWTHPYFSVNTKVLSRQEMKSCSHFPVDLEERGPGLWTQGWGMVTSLVCLYPLIAFCPWVLYFLMVERLHCPPIAAEDGCPLSCRERELASLSTPSSPRRKYT